LKLTNIKRHHTAVRKTKESQHNKSNTWTHMDIRLILLRAIKRYYLNTIISKVTVNLNRLNNPIKRQVLGLGTQHSG
jgi:hypothetical protein